MERLSLGEMKRLAGHSSDLNVSIYIPTHRRHPETEQDPIRFRNQIRLLEAELAGRSLRKQDVDAFLEPARALLGDARFWRHQQDGLALFMASNEFHAYRLPFTVSERTVLAEHFYLSPLIPLFTNNGHFYILALSQNSVRLFEGTRYSVGEIDLPTGTPQSVDEVAPDGEDPGLQARSSGVPGSGESMFHGHGGGGSVERMRIGRFLNELDKSLLPILKESGAPLVIAGDIQLLPIYREVTDYAHVVEDGPRGNPELLRPEELHEQAWPHVEGIFRGALDTELAQYGAQAGTGRTGASLEEVVPAAFTGRVGTLMIVPGLEVWGAWEPDSLRVRRVMKAATGAVELEGFAAAHTLLNGGAVFVVEPDEMPNHAEVAAIFRY